MVWMLINNIEFFSIIDRDYYVKEWQNLQNHCSQYDSNTMLSEIAISDKNSHKIVIIERYNDKSNYHDIHKISAPFIQFNNKTKDLVTLISENSYIIL